VCTPSRLHAAAERDGCDARYLLAPGEGHAVTMNGVVTS
jgi:hypothetical protein